MNYLTAPSLSLNPCKAPIVGSLCLPGSKSITNRALLLAALAKGESRLLRALASDDTRHMSEALLAMGVTVESPSPSEFRVVSEGFLTEPVGPLFLGNAGTATRFLTAALATQKGTFIVDGDEHMQKRPIAPLVDALSRLGISARTDTGCPPVEITSPGGFGASKVEIDAGLSSQYISALLMAGPLHSEAFQLQLTGTDIGAKGYIEITLSVMRAFGAEVAQINEGLWVVQPTGYQPVPTYHIEPDASAATYLWAAEKLTNGKIDLGVAPQSMMQPDAQAWDIIQAWPHMPGEIEGSQIQDAIPTLAVMAAFNQTPVRFVGIENLRVKECDRISACCNELNRIKPRLAGEEQAELLVHSDPGLIGGKTDAQIETYHDHRIAMAFSLAGLLMEGITILDPGCVAKTYPEYWNDLASLGVSLVR
ncbi:MAG: 3-phosphoshikimate 1-carboxyvinyltransferase [Verrucomicrobiales bacterium]|nr:3-phosphoshikimate 1-carboxyvinyltransferase [Verrucomicrobiales bacterium]